jgi:hypothetical protein
MYLAVFDLVDATHAQLADWLGDPDCVPILTRPIVGITADMWRHAATELRGFEEEGYKFFDVFRPIFAAGKKDLGPRARKAEISFTATVDYWLFCQTRFDWTLLREMQRASRLKTPTRIELITDRWDGGPALRPTKAFAEARQIPWKTAFFSHRTSFTQRMRRTVREAVRRVYPSAQSAVQCLEDRGRRLQALAQNSKGREKGNPAKQVLENVSGARIRAAMSVYQPKSWRYLLPIYDELVRQKQAAIFISTRSTTEVPLRELDLPYVANKHGCASPWLVHEIRDYFAEFPLDEPAAERVGAADLLAPLHAILRDAAGELANFYVDFARLMPDTFRRYRINTVLGTDSGSAAGRALFRTAERMGIASYFIQHGVFGDLPGQADYFTDSQILVWGKTSRDSLLHSGVPEPKRIHAFGSPFLEQQFDILKNTDISLEEHSDVIVAFGIPSDICSEVSFRVAAEEIVHAAQELPHLRFLVKLHPGDHSGIFTRLAERAALPNFHVVKTGDIYRMIAGSRVVLTQFSTSGSEAIHLGRPVVAVLLDGTEWRIDYLVEDAAYVVRRAGELRPLLENILSVDANEHRLADRQRQFAKDFLHRENKSAAERLADLIQEVEPAQPATMSSTPG